MLSLWQGWLHGKELWGKTWGLIKLEAQLSVGVTLVSTLVVCLTSILTHIGLASTIIIVPIEFYAYVILTIGMVPVAIIIAVVIFATSAAFKQPMG